MLSALIIPGAGHWYLGKRWQAVALMLASFAALSVLVSNAITQASLLADRILSGEIQPEMSALMNLLAEQQHASTSNSMTFATVAVALIWLTGIVGAWISGREADSQKKSAAPVQID